MHQGRPRPPLGRHQQHGVRTHPVTRPTQGWQRAGAGCARCGTISHRPPMRPTASSSAYHRNRRPTPAPSAPGGRQRTTRGWPQHQRNPASRGVYGWGLLLLLQILTILLLPAQAAATATPGQPIIFTPVGELWHANAIIHLTLNVDLAHLEQQCRILRHDNISAMPHFRAHAEMIRLANLATRLTDDICAEVDMAEGGHRQEGRQDKRQLLGLGAIIATTAYMAYQQHKVNGLTGQVRQQGEALHQHVLVLEQQQRHLEDLTARIQQQQGDMAVLVNQVNTYLTAEDHMAQLQERVNLLLELDRAVHKVTHGLDRLRRGDLTTDLFRQQDLDHIFRTLGREAKGLQGTLPFSRAEHLLGLPATGVSTAPYHYRILLHVPVVRQKLRLMEFRPMPVPITDTNATITLIPTPDHELLAFTDLTHRELSWQDLQSCWRQTTTYVCVGMAAFHLRPRSSCLGALYVGDLSAAKGLCDWRVARDQWRAVVIGNHKIALYLREPGRGQISCPTRVHQAVDQAVDLQHFQILNLPADCALTAKDLHVTSRYDVLLEEAIQVRPAGTYIHLLHNATPTGLEELQRRLEQHHWQPQDTVPELLRQARALDQHLRHQGEHGTFLLALGGGLAALGLLILALALGRYLCLCGPRPALRGQPGAMDLVAEG